MRKEKIDMNWQKHDGLGRFGRGDCSGWERDLQSFSKVVAEHYLRTEMGLSLRAKSIWCRPDGKGCEVYFPGDVTVGVSFVGVPGYVIARQFGPAKPRREYNYDCTPEGKVILTPRNRQSQAQPAGFRTALSHPGFGQPPAPSSTFRDSELTMVRDAIGRNIRNENALSDLVFFSRHPERNGRLISRGEPNFKGLSEEWLLIRGCLVRPALLSPPELQRFLDQVRLRPADHEKLFLTLGLHPNPLQAFVDHLSSVYTLVINSIARAPNQRAVIEAAVAHLMCIALNHQSLNPGFDLRVKDEIDIQRKLGEAANSLGLPVLEPFLLDALLISNPTHLWEVGLNLSQNALPPAISQRAFQSSIANAHYNALGWALRIAAERHQRANSSFKSKVEQERRRRQQLPRRPHIQPGRPPHRGQIPV
jgi:hypothetical protein